MTTTSDPRSTIVEYKEERKVHPSYADFIKDVPSSRPIYLLFPDEDRTGVARSRRFVVSGVAKKVEIEPA